MIKHQINFFESHEILFKEYKLRAFKITNGKLFANDSPLIIFAFIDIFTLH
jgi:hypothetical protein